MNRKVLIFGASGQDGQILSKFLESKGYNVFKVSKNSKSDYVCDITDHASVLDIWRTINPDYVYDLASYTSVGGSFERPGYTVDTNCVGICNILDIMKSFPQTKLIHASSSEIFGKLINLSDRYHENSLISPLTPYGVAKAAAYHMCQVYKNSFSLNISCGILFNHTSKFQSEYFLIPKVAKYLRGDMSTKLKLGNLDSYRDFISAYDVCNALYMMRGSNQNYLVCSGKSYQIRFVVQKMFEIKGIKNWESYVDFNTKELSRPNQTLYSQGCPYKIYKELGWIDTYTLRQILEDVING